MINNANTARPIETTRLEELTRINAELEAHKTLSRETLIKEGIIRESDETVYRVGASDDPKQRLPFSKLFLPAAHTGILEPSKAVTDVHRAINVIMPGVGTNFSVAQTLCDIAGTFHGRKSKNRGKARQNDPAYSDYTLPSNSFFRAASFPTDLPLNGMGGDAPFEFSSKEGLLEVIRHVYLVLTRLYPNRPVFLSGRSQGGIAALLYGQHYDDIAGVVAINPPHPDPELFQFTIDYLESKIDNLSELLHAPGVDMNFRSWEGYKQFTPTFTYPDNKLRCPALILVSLGDPFNLFPKYAEMLQVFADSDELCQLEILDAGHNLWDRKLSDTYHRVVSLQTDFMLRQITK